jgi:uncharacterized protein (TIGR03437 family)
MNKTLKVFLSGLFWLLPAAADTAWRPTDAMSAPRRDHVSVLLPNAKVLVAGYLTNAAELYDANTGQFTPAGRMPFLHGQGLTATLLKNGTVLIAGGTDAPLNAELYDPVSARFAATVSMTSPHAYHTATLLADGRVLIAGGLNSGQSNSVAEIYDPTTRQFTPTASMGTAREGHTATLLHDGRVLIVGGVQASGSGSTALNTAELFDPAAGVFAPTNHNLLAERYAHYAVLLGNGQVLIGGGFPNISAELFDPSDESFTLTGTMTVPRGAATATLLPSGKVLVAGGFTGAGPTVTSTAELYDPASGMFTATGSMNARREEHSATALFDGRVLVTGGYGGSTDLSSAELYTPVGEGLLASQSGLTFRVAAGAGKTSSQNIAVLSTAEIPWKISVSTYSGGGWLSTNPVSATSSIAVGAIVVTVSANPTGLAAGDYYGIITITPSDKVHPPLNISVVLNVVAPNTSVPPLVSPTGLVFLATGNGSLSPQSIGITDVASYAIGTTLTSPQFDSGLSVSRRSIVVASGLTESFAVSVDPSNLAPGAYRYSINLAFTDTTNQVVDVLLVVAPGAVPTPQAVRSRLRSFDQTACTPTQLLPVFTTLSGGFTTPAAWPTAVVVSVVDDCASKITTGDVTVTFGNGDSPLALLSIGEGDWSATWTPTHAVAGFKITASAQLQQPALQGKTEISGQVPLNPQVPVVTPGGVVSAADYTSSPAPGLLVSIFGSSLADSTAGAQTLPLPEQLTGTSVVIGSEQAPLLFAADGQVNIVVPYDLAPQTKYQLVVQRGNSISVPITVTVASAQPAILSTSGTGTGQGHIYRIDSTGGTALADAQTPAQAGQVLVIYCAGLGAVSPSVPAGSGSPPGGALSYTNAPVSLTIGGQPADVKFAGLAPGFAGLYQLNAVMPGGVAAGDQVPVTISVAGQNSIANISMAVR